MLRHEKNWLRLCEATAKKARQSFALSILLLQVGNYQVGKNK